MLTPVTRKRPMSLDRIRIIMVNTSHPGNIGATARAMKNMGLSQLYLVAPEDFPSPQAAARASGADDLLSRTVVCEDLDQALKECQFIIGTSARERRIRWPQLSPREAARRIVEEAQSATVAILFGRESMGLSNAELDRCHYHLAIPAHEAYPSLNLACAVQVVAYELFLAAMTHDPLLRDEDREHPRPTNDDLVYFYEHLEQVLRQLQFLDPDNPRLLMRRLKRLFNRAELDQNELNILRGILTAIEQHGPKGLEKGE
jgi:tRNA (cytidine32/uridine32-2'-O)-methyltransferase